MKYQSITIRRRRDKAWKARVLAEMLRELSNPQYDLLSIRVGHYLKSPRTYYTYRFVKRAD